MLSRTRPEIGNWYHDRQRDLVFEVVAIDDRDKTVEIQHFNGDIEDIDMEVFAAMPLRRTSQPEDWTGPYEIEEEDEVGVRDEFADFPEYERDYMHIVERF